MTLLISPETTGVLGLDRLVRRLIAEDGFADREAALQGIAAYERFFFAASVEQEPVVPSVRVDRVWQRHMRRAGDPIEVHRLISAYSPRFAECGAEIKALEKPGYIVVRASENRSER